MAVAGPHLRFVAPSLDLVLDTLTTGVAVAVAAMGWARYREQGQPVALFQTAAFLVLGATNTSTVVLELTGLDSRTGSTLGAPGQAPLYVFTLTRLLAACLLLAGSMEALRNHHPRRAWPVLGGSAIATCLALALLAVPSGSLPALASIAAVSPGAGAVSAGAPIPALTLLGAAASVLVAALYLGAAGVSRRLYRRDGSVGEAYLAVGLVVAGFAQIADAFPGQYTGVVTSGDLLRLAFDAILLIGIQADIHATLGQLQAANLSLARLQTLEVERAALAERARLSRELHDGVAQSLWLAKLKVGRLAALPELGLEAAALAGELGTAIEAGLVEAQQAVVAMRTPGEPSGTLRDLLARSVNEFADRFGVRVEFDCSPDLPQLSPRAQAEALRIAQEALTNVRRHADATVVRVRARVTDGRLVVDVGDNGCGFDPAAVSGASFGLAGMRERAALIGGEVRIESAPRDGTRIRLFLPLVPAVAVTAVNVR